MLNLGFYAHDPYQLFFLSEYYRKIYNPETVLLVIERDYEAWLNGHPHPLNFNYPENFGKKKKRISNSEQRLMSGTGLSFINLLASAIKLSGGGGTEINTEEGC